MQRQQASQTAASRHHRQNLQEKPGENSGGSGRDRRENMPEAGPAPMAGIMQGGGDGLQNGRAEGFYARGIRSTPGLFTTHYSPPNPMQEPPDIPAKSTASTISTAGRQQAQDTPATPAPPAQRAKPTAQHNQHQQTAQPTPHRHSQRQHTQQPASTTPGRADRNDDGGDRRSDHHRPGPEGVGTPGGDCKVCGFGSAKVF